MREQENLKKLHTILSQVLGVAESAISDTMGPDTVESWDSYNALMLVSELETVFNVHFTMDEVVFIKNVGDVKTVLRKHDIEI